MHQQPAEGKEGLRVSSKRPAAMFFAATGYRFCVADQRNGGFSAPALDEADSPSLRRTSSAFRGKPSLE